MYVVGLAVVYRFPGGIAGHAGGIDALVDLSLILGVPVAFRSFGRSSRESRWRMWLAVLAFILATSGVAFACADVADRLGMDYLGRHGGAYRFCSFPPYDVFAIPFAATGLLVSAFAPGRPRATVSALSALTLAIVLLRIR